tara:strand:+ start:1232 stop:1651 length:420 start_codon:yes stop_codon:yes gene_type:complete
MSEKLNSIVGAPSDFATRFMGGDTIPTISTSSTPLTLTPPPGQRVRLTHLSTNAGEFMGGMSVLFDGVTVFAGTINGPAPQGAGTSSFSIGKYQPYAAGAPPAGNYKLWTGAVDEVLTLVKDGGANPSRPVNYGYQFGE